MVMKNSHNIGQIRNLKYSGKIRDISNTGYEFLYWSANIVDKKILVSIAAMSNLRRKECKECLDTSVASEVHNAKEEHPWRIFTV